MNYITAMQHSLSTVGIGTWGLGEGNDQQSQAELEAIQYGLSHGINVIDTAEMYGDGKSELLVGKAIQNFNRAKLFIVSKFYPWHATASGMQRAIEGSLKRLHTDYLDLYLLHWTSDTPIEVTLKEAAELKKAGLIRNFGVSNFDTDEMLAAMQEPNGQLIQANEVLYNLATRGIEFDLLPEMMNHQLLSIGYSPYGSGSGLNIQLPTELHQLALSKQITDHQLLLAWVLRDQNLISIPKASSVKHMQENIAATDIKFSTEELRLINQFYPEPTHKVDLGII